MQISTVVVVIQQGKEGGDKIIGKVKKGNTLGKIVFFRDLKEVGADEFPDIGDEVEVHIVNEFEKYLHCTFFEDTAHRLLMRNAQKEATGTRETSVEKVIPDHMIDAKPVTTVFNKSEYTLTSVEEVNDFLSDRAFALVETLVKNDKIIYIVKRQ